jgi:outer membrane protein assembly factor BamB
MDTLGSLALVAHAALLAAGCRATISPIEDGVCGDGARNSTHETCDGADLGGKACHDVLGPGSEGTLACTAACGWDVSACSAPIAGGNSAGLQSGSPWPSWGFDPARSAQSPFVGPQTGEIAWVYRPDIVGGANLASSPVIAADGTIYIGTFNGLIALGPSGQRKWLFETWHVPPPFKGCGDGETCAQDDPSEPVPVDTTAMIGADGTIYFCSLPLEELYALSPTGSLLWSKPFRQIDAPPTIAADQTIYASLVLVDAPHDWREDSWLVAMNRDGSLRWKYHLAREEKTWSSPAVARDGTVHVVTWGPNGENVLHAVHPDGTRKWTFPIDAWQTLTPSVGPDGTVYVYADLQTYAVNADGTLHWVHQHAASGRSSPVLGPDGTVYVVTGQSNTCLEDSEPGSLDAIHPDGSPKWSYPLAANDCNRETSKDLGIIIPAIGSDGTIYVTHGSAIDAVNPDGSRKWKSIPHPTVVPRPPLGSPAIGNDGRLYAANGDGFVFAFGP